MSTTLERIETMRADHYESLEQFEREQVKQLADTLQEVIDIVGFQPGPPYDYPLFKSIYSIPRLLAHIRDRIA